MLVGACCPSPCKGFASLNASRTDATKAKLIGHAHRLALAEAVIRESSLSPPFSDCKSARGGPHAHLRGKAEGYPHRSTSSILAERYGARWISRCQVCRACCSACPSTVPIATSGQPRMRNVMESIPSRAVKVDVGSGRNENTRNPAPKTTATLTVGIATTDHLE
jgi:hypothetical protein